MSVSNGLGYNTLTFADKAYASATLKIVLGNDTLSPNYKWGIISLVECTPSTT